MLRSRTVHTIHELAAQGQSIGAVARTLGLSRNTVRKYLRGAPDAEPRRKRETKLEPFTAQIRRWAEEDHLYNCVTMLERLKPLGYAGGITQLKELVHPLRPRSVTRRPVRRFETKPGEQLQFDWGEFRYEEGGVERKLFGFVAVLGYSRMRFVAFTKRADAPTLIRGLMAAFEYLGGVPRAVLTDRMKSVLLAVEDGTPKPKADNPGRNPFAPARAAVVSARQDRTQVVVAQPRLSRERTHRHPLRPHALPQLTSRQPHGLHRAPLLSPVAAPQPTKQTQKSAQRPAICIADLSALGSGTLP